MTAPAWLVARPIAHRGLHDRANGVVENTLEAASAAIAGGYAIECDVTASADGEAMVFHDETLDRLTEARGPVAALGAERLAEIRLRHGGARIPTLAGLLGLIAGRVPLVCEIKSVFDGDLRLARRAVEVARDYAGPLAFKSFDPDIVAALATLAPDRPRGIVGEVHYDHPEWAGLSVERRHAMGNLLHFPESKPDFLSWYVRDLQFAAPQLCRRALGVPVMTWTVRTQEDRALGAAGADQIVFEGFTP
jgi:glycerophosphoryl diester phosphodiesterase